MTEISKPDPLPTATSLPFWRAATAGRLDLQFCTNCHRFVHYPRTICPYCLSDRLEWRTVSGRGVVYSFTIVRQAPSPAFSDVPYVLAAVDLEEGVRLIGQMTTTPNDVRIGASVKAIFERRDQFAVPEFELLDTDTVLPAQKTLEAHDS